LPPLHNGERVYQKRLWFGVDDHLSFFSFFLSLSPPKILRFPLQNFRTTPSISFSFSGPYHFDYDFFLF
jgi:hypothetical protein